MTDRIEAHEEMPEMPTTTLPTPSRRHGSLGTATLGFVLIGGGLFWLLDRLEVVDVAAAVVLPLILTAVGVALLIGAFDGEHAGLVVLGVFLSVGVLVVSTTPLGFITNGIGERSFSPNVESDLADPFQLGIGELRVDFSDLVVVGDATARAELGLGEMRVTVPDGVAVEINSEAGAGEITVFGEKKSGTGISDVYRSPGFDGADRQMTIYLEVAIGTVEVMR